MKQRIAVLVNASQDEALLQDVARMLYQNKPAANELYYRNRLKKSIKQANTGQVKSATEVHQMVRRWIVK